MMRFQRISPDYLPQSNGRRPNVRTCKEDDAEISKALNHNGFDRKATRFRFGSNPSTDQDQSSSHFAASDSPQLDNHASKTQNNKQENCSGVDVLLQWGHNKRSRRSRKENRVVTDESSVLERKVIKIHRRVVSVGQKQVTNDLVTAMPPPSTTAAYSRGTNLRPCSLINRNLDERSTPVNISYSNDRTLPRSCKKGAPSPEKTEKASSCSVTATGEKLNGSIEQAVPMNVESVAHPEPETAAAAEKRNLDQLEWPRICISLSRKEKEYDFLIMKGTKLPQRPKKRAKNVDRSLQYCFPGMWLSDLTRGRYEVREKKCVKKKRTGLKGMESMDSDSE
ncbi:hypothetical protein MRB53_026681 [Persea americana]|uniref:Uncharacterized protein n=1 Tax=Persea americana TaxID=3435 RepID=A0ACC2LIQ3_PERAE|nr:hypothetical protein MRB53_026681 [Persea americana]